MTAVAARWERRPDARPQEILEAALVVFARRGYRATRLEEIGEAAGVTKGTIYHYFATKEEVLLRAIEHYHEQAFGRAEDALRGTTGPISAQLRLLVRRWYGEVTSERLAVLTLLLQGVAHDAPEAYTRWLAQGPARATALVASLIEDGKANGEFRGDADSDVAARILVSGLLLQTSWMPHRDTIPALAIAQDRLVESAMEFFLHGLQPR